MGSGGERPSGTVTFLFTDIEGSTKRWEADPDTMRVELAAHDEVLKQAVEGQGGWLFKHTGDGVCAAFASPVAAVRAAIDAQQVLELPVRMGVATGDAQLRGDDYFGPPLNLAARVMSAGHGGQVLVAAATAGLVDRVDLVDLGERRLKDLSAAQRIFQVVADGLRRDFPPLATLDEVPGNLPVQVTSFMGRADDVAEVAAALRSHRLVTLTGVGGVGKTRLGLQVAAELSGEFPDGIWSIELAEIGDPDAVSSAVAAELGVVPSGETPLVSTIAESFGGRRALLVLDNCEHVLDVVADLAQATLAAGQEVKILATSREGLRVAGEHVWSVPSLETRGGAESAAFALFVDRATAADQTFTVDTDETARVVTEICTRLDGIALAIELAAARIVVMSPADIRDRLGQRFRLLSGGRRGLERHQTLRQAVQWSYELLTDDERAMLDGCSVFAGGFDVAGVVEIVGGGRLDEFDVLDLLESLARKSLLVVDRAGGATRYSMLETIRQFAEEQLSAAGLVEDMRNRHGRYFAHCSEIRTAQYVSPDVAVALRWYEAELGNLRAAFRWSADNGDLDVAGEIAGQSVLPAVWNLSYEPIDWCEELLPEAIRTRHRLIKKLYAGASMCAYIGRPEEGYQYATTGRAIPFSDGIELLPHEDDVAGFVGSCLFTGRGDEFIETARANYHNPDDLTLGWPISLLWLLAAEGRFDEAIEIADDVLRRSEERRNPSQLSFAWDAYGRAHSQTDPVKALDAIRRAVDFARESHSRLYEAVWSRDLAGFEARFGDPVRAAESMGEILDGFHRRGDTGNLAAGLGYVAILLARVEMIHAAAEILGAAIRSPAAVASVPELEAEETRLREALGDDAVDESIEAGRSMSVADAVIAAKRHLQTVAEGR
jgi:predicted ATPase/class 3 adenylate cyclase